MGHCGQVALGYLAYTVFTRAMLFSMESRPAEHDLYMGLSLRTFSAETMWAMGRTLVSNKDDQASKLRGPAHRQTLVFSALLLAGCYILAFPVMLSAMTGYQAVSTSYVARPDTGDLINMTALRQTQIVLIDGDRVGLTPNFSIPIGSGYETQFTNYIETYGDIPGTPDNPYTNLYSNKPSSAKETYQNVSSQVTVSSTTLDLDPPLLAFYNVPGTLIRYTAENVTFNDTWIKANGKCEPSEEYRWGFSFLFLFIFCALTATFVALLCAVWWTVYWHGRFDRTDQGFNAYSAVMDLASNIAADLGDAGADLTAEQLRKEVRRRRCVVKLNTQDLPMSRRDEDMAARQGKHDAKLLPRNRGVLGYFFTEQDVGRAKAVLPQWKDHAMSKVKLRDDMVELGPVPAGPYARIPEKPDLPAAAGAEEGIADVRRDSAESSPSSTSSMSLQSEATPGALVVVSNAISDADDAEEAPESVSEPGDSEPGGRQSAESERTPLTLDVPQHTAERDATRRPRYERETTPM